VKLLLDENLSPAAAVALNAGGIDACHVRDRGILGATDHEVLERAFLEDRILVTSNVDDFVKLARAREITQASCSSSVQACCAMNRSRSSVKSSRSSPSMAR
jgi:predicted nuclease of predicted toxin-antitoxin system